MSNKTPKEQPKETASAPKNNKYYFLKFILAFIVIILSASFFVGIYYTSDNSNMLQTPKGDISLEIVDTPESRQIGLSGRNSISDTQGMLFVFDNSSANNCFWMKDMNFSIDMVWLNDKREVVTVTYGVSPETFPETFCPEQPAKYGLELNDGNAAKLEIAEGTKLLW